ncbi:MAG: dehalogenase [Chloroflexi bacterium]|nr:dehalogenase [Chloroflexota bacterium]
MVNSGLLWFIIGIGTTLAFFGLKEWLDEKQVALNWWQWLLAVAWTLVLALTVAFTALNAAANEARAAMLGFVILAVILAVWAVLGWYFILRRKLVKAA